MERTFFSGAIFPDEERTLFFGADIILRVQVWGARTSKKRGGG